MKFSIKDNNENIVCVVDSLKELNAIDFLNAYGFLLDDYNKTKKEKNIDFLEFLKEKTKDPYLNNLLKETDFQYQNGKLKDEEGEYQVFYKAIVGGIIVYFFNHYLWLYSPKENKKYFYYTD